MRGQAAADRTVWQPAPVDAAELASAAAAEEPTHAAAVRAAASANKSPKKAGKGKRGKGKRGAHGDPWADDDAYF